MNNQVMHELKILPEHFQAVWDGVKTFEVRKNDRDYAVGDTLVLKEWTPKDGYTGSGIARKVTYILNDSKYVKEGFIIMGLSTNPPPVHTINPGDEVRHSKHGMGIAVMIDHPDVWVTFDKCQYDTLVPIDSLEVIGNE